MHCVAALMHWFKHCVLLTGA